MLSNVLDLVLFLNQYDAAPIAEIARRFHYAPNSYTSLTTRLKHLSWPEDSELSVDEKQREKDIRRRILEKRWILHPLRRKGEMLIYFNGAEGQKMVREAGFEVKRTSFGRGTLISDHNWHNINANQPLVSAHLWAENTPGVRVAAMQTAFDFDRNKELRQVMNLIYGSNHGIRQDGLLAFAFEDENKDDKQFLIEFETGSQEPAAIRRKVEGLVRFEQEFFTKVFDSRLFSGYLFFATATYGIKQGKPRYASPDDHRKILLREIAKQLREMDCEEYAPLFRVTAEPPDSLHLFDRPCWYFPNHYDPVRLFVDLG